MGSRVTIGSKYRNAGQACLCANHILVQDGIPDAATERRAEAQLDQDLERL
jgi:acyl-CoA reductase-like NAD-dependent aldehyde dehydrogenase